jgi:Flp pilus assembly pilin Flp
MFVLARTFAKDESGTAVEYSLAVAGISFGLIMAMDALDPELRTTLAKVTAQLATLGGGSALRRRAGCGSWLAKS